jgi:hypothetical protein
VFELRGLKKGSVPDVQGFVESEAVNTTRSAAGGVEIYSQTRQGLTLRRRKEHGNTFAHELEYSPRRAAYRLNEEKIIRREQQEKTFFPCITGIDRGTKTG